VKVLVENKIMTTPFEIVAFKSDFYHNGHSMQRDRLLICIHGKKWLEDMKAKGYFGADWPDEIIGTPKEGDSGYIDENGNVAQAGRVVELKSLEDLDKYFNELDRKLGI